MTEQPAFSRPTFPNVSGIRSWAPARNVNTKHVHAHPWHTRSAAPKRAGRALCCAPLTSGNTCLSLSTTSVAFSLVMSEYCAIERCWNQL